MARGKHLREFLGVDDENLLADRTFRNHFEHYDERIDDWFESSNSAVYTDYKIGSLGPSPSNLPQLVHRSYDPTSRTLTFRNELIDLAEVLSALAEVRERCRGFVLP